MSYRLFHVFRILRSTSRQVSRGLGLTAPESFSILRMGAHFGPEGAVAALGIIAAIDIYAQLYPPPTEEQRYQHLFGARGKTIYQKEQNDRETEKDWIGKA